MPIAGAFFVLRRIYNRIMDIKWRDNNGFTLMEAMVVLAIITMLSAVTLISFTGVNDAITLRKERFQVALAIREAQNMALAVKLIAGGITAPAYGVRFSTVAGSSSTYFIFADSNNNRVYDSGETKIGGDSITGDRTMEKGIKVSVLTPQSGSPPPVAYITFASPEAEARMADGSGTPLGEWLEITLANRSGTLTARIRIRTSGQVTLR